MRGGQPRRYAVLTLFPSIIDAYASVGVIGRAVREGLASIQARDIRDFADGPYRAVDDVPFGGGAGMVMQPEPVARAIEAVGPVKRRVLLAAGGRPFRQADAEAWAELDSMLFLCGRYEGVDARIEADYMDDVVSIGDYVLSGGELPALVVIDAIMRLLPGVLGNAESAVEESYNGGLLECPHYTRPAQWRGRAVPSVLLSGHHGRIAAWRRQRAIARTYALRPDLLASAELTAAEREFLLALKQGAGTEKSEESEP